MTRVLAPSGGREPPIDPVVPAPLQRPVLARVRELPELGGSLRSVLADSADLQLGIARPDASGRLSARGLLRALGWDRCHRLSLEVVEAAIVVFGSETGVHAVGDRGEIMLPAWARRLVGIEDGTAVVLAAFVSDGALVVHPAAVVARFLSELHAGAMGCGDAG